MAASPLWVSEELEYWDSNIRFTHIAATYSELIAISTNGQLHQWRWSDAHPYQRNDVSYRILRRAQNDCRFSIHYIEKMRCWFLMIIQQIILAYVDIC